MASHPPKQPTSRSLLWLCQVALRQQTYLKSDMVDSVLALLGGRGSDRIRWAVRFGSSFRHTEGWPTGCWVTFGKWPDSTIGIDDEPAPFFDREADRLDG